MIRWFRWAWIGFCLLILLGPLLHLGLQSLHIEADVWEHLRSHLLFSSLRETFIFSLGSAFVALFIGMAWALLSLVSGLPVRFFSLVMLVVLAIPTYVMGFSILSFIDYGGPLQSLFMKRFGASFHFEPRTIFYAILLYGLAASPYVYFSVLAGLKTKIRSYIEASVTMGAGFFRSLTKIILPSIFPWALGGATLVALEASADFGFVDIFGINTLSRLLYKSWGSLFSFAGAARISVVLLLFCLGILLLNKFFQKPQSSRVWSKLEDFRGLFYFSKGYQHLFRALFFLGVFVFNLLPILILAVHASDLSLWQDLPWIRSLFATLQIGLFSSLMVGLIASILYFSSRSEKLLSIFFIGYGMPGTLLAVGFFLFCSFIFGADVLGNSSSLLFVLLILLYFVKFSGLMLKGLENQGKQKESAIFEVASLLSTPKRNFIYIKLPTFMPAIVLGFLLLFLEIIKELPAALMIKPLETPSLALRIYQYTAESDWERASVFSLALVFLVISVGLIFKLCSDFFDRGKYHVSQD